MHEFSLASGIIDLVLSEAEKNGIAKVDRITIEVGALSMVGLEQLSFALSVLSEGTIAEGAKIVYDTPPVKVRCELGHVSVVEAPESAGRIYSFVLNLRCPVCDGKAEAVEGRDCRVKEIEGE